MAKTFDGNLRRALVAATLSRGVHFTQGLAPRPPQRVFSFHQMCVLRKGVAHDPAGRVRGPVCLRLHFTGRVRHLLEAIRR